MPRKTSRSLLRPLTLGAKADFTGKGPDVSDDVQLTYLVDTLVETLWVSAGAGKFRPSIFGLHGIIQLQCKNERGLIIDELIAVPILGATTPVIMSIRTEDVADPITSPLDITPRVTSGGTALGLVVSGYVDDPYYIANQGFFMFGATAGWGRGVYLEANRFLMLLSDQKGAAHLMAIRWHELDDRAVQ